MKKIFLILLFLATSWAVMGIDGVTAYQVYTDEGPALRLVVNTGEMLFPPIPFDYWAVRFGPDDESEIEWIYDGQIDVDNRVIFVPLAEPLPPGPYVGEVELWSNGVMLDWAHFDFEILYRYWGIIPHAVYLPEWQTSIAFGNHTDAPVAVEMTFYSESGAWILGHVIELPAHGSRSFFFNDVPYIETFVGNIYLESDFPIRFDYLSQEIRGDAWVPMSAHLVKKGYE